jgi:hypothetical protein
VPIFQALEDFTVYLVLILLERRLNRWPDGAPRTGYPAGAVLATGMVLWGFERSLDEHLWLGEDGRVGSILVQVAGVALVLGGIALLVGTRRRWRRWLDQGAPGGRPEAVEPGLTEATGPADEVESPPAAASGEHEAGPAVATTPDLAVDPGSRTV